MSKYSVVKLTLNHLGAKARARLHCTMSQLGHDSPSCTPARAPAAHTVGKTGRTKRQRHNLHRRLIQKVRTCVYSLVFTPSMRQVFTANESWSLPLAPRAGLHRPQSGRFLPPTGAGLYRSHPGQVFTALNPAGFHRRAPTLRLATPLFNVRVSVCVYFAHPRFQCSCHCSRFCSYFCSGKMGGGGSGGGRGGGGSAGAHGAHDVLRVSLGFSRPTGLELRPYFL